MFRSPHNFSLENPDFFRKNKRKSLAKNRKCPPKKVKKKYLRTRKAWNKKIEVLNISPPKKRVQHFLGKTVPPQSTESCTHSCNLSSLSKMPCNSYLAKKKKTKHSWQHSKISPTWAPWKIPKGNLTNSLWRNFFLCWGERGSLGYLPRVCGQNHWKTQSYETYRNRCKSWVPSGIS